MGSKSSAPPAPDYTAAAQAQGAANKEAAQASGFINNPNIINPYGTQTVTWGSPNTGSGSNPVPTSVFDQNAYNAAMQKWQAGQQTAQVPSGDSGFDVASPQQNSAPMPTKEQFTTTLTTGGGGSDMLQPTVTQTLNPQSQAILNAQLQNQLGLQQTGTKALQTVQSVMGQPFQYNGPALQTSVGSAGQIPGAPNLSNYGQAGGNNAFSGLVNWGPNAGGYGYAQGANTQNLAQMPVNAGTTGQQAIMNRLQPQLEMQDKQIQNQLANQGIMPGSEAYDNAMRQYSQSRNDLLSQAALQGIGLDLSANQQGFNQALQGQQLVNQAIGQNFGQGLASAGFGNAAQQQLYGQNYGNQQLVNQAIAQNQNAALQQQQAGLNAQNQAFNQALQGAQFGNTAQQQALQQQLALYNQPLNTISALMSGAQVQNPQFQAYQGANVAPAPIMQGVQNQYNSALQNYSANNAANNDFMGGLFGLGGTIAAAPSSSVIGKLFSDRRLKSNVQRIGTHKLGIGIYSYTIFGRPAIGVMADEVEKIIPEAVLTHSSGFKMVDYGRL